MRVAEAPPGEAPVAAARPGARRNVAVECALVGATWLVGQLVFFRSQWLSGFDRVMGDPGAARFIIYVNENWYQSLLGHAAWKSPAFYYPLKNTLGLSDTFFVWQLVYTPARALGADPFLAYQLTLIALTAAGFATFYALTRQLWRPPIVVGLLGSALFAFSNALYVNANHPQLFGVLLLPGALVLWVAAWRAGRRRPWWSLVLGALAGALYVLVCYSTYYVGFFSVLAIEVATLLSALVAPRAAVARLRELRDGCWRAAAGAALGAVLPAALFLDTFLPALRASGGYHLAAARFFAPTPLDGLNVGFGNLLWGTVLVRAAVHGTAALSERDYALTPVLLVATAVAVVAATVLERRATVAPGGRRYSSAVLLAAGLVLMAAPMAVGPIFLWDAVYWLPGASGIRAIDRIGLVGGAVVVLALVDAAARLAPWLRRTVPRPLLLGGVVVLAAVLCLEQVNISDSSQLSRRGQLAVLDAVPKPPARCGAFFVETAHGSAVHPARVQTTAMLLSERFSLPTLNGTSGSFPTGWHLFYPSAPGYLVNVRRWVRERHVTVTVCALDLDTDRWATFAVASSHR